MPKTSSRAGTNGKRSAAERERIRQRLDDQRQEILSLYVQDLKQGQRSSDEGAEDLVDRANSAYTREFMLSLSGGEREMLREVEQAIARLDEGTYGNCAHCEEKIPARRLKAVPWARYCISCQELSEQGLLYDS